MLVQSYQVLNKLAKRDSSEYGNYYADVNYAFCIVIFGQVIGVMCAKMAKLLDLKKESNSMEGFNFSPDSQILIVDTVYLIILIFLNRRFKSLFGPET